METEYDGTLDGLCRILDEVCQEGAPLPDFFHTFHTFNLFNSADRPPRGAAFFSSLPSHPGLEELFELSAVAHDDFIQAWLSELPIQEELLAFAWKIIAAGRQAPAKSPEARRRAARALGDREDRAVRVVRDAAYKTRHETHRLMGLLRFAPEEGVQVARCRPDHLVLPALAEHFGRRFGEKTPWAIIDEKRALMASPQGFSDAPAPRDLPCGKDPWQELWRDYHRAVNNESRRNPALQRAFMPRRYWPYLPEMQG